MHPPFRTAIVGHIQALNALLPAFQAVPGFAVTALCGRNSAIIRAAAAQAGIGKTHPTWEALADDPTIEVVALALPPLLQSQAVVRLAAAGKHLFCEKPLAADLAGARAMFDAVTARQRVAVVNFGFRMIEAFRDFHSITRSGILGAPQSGMVEWLLATRRDPSMSWNWKSDARQGGGTLSMMTTHVFDYLGWCFGEIIDARLQATSLVPARPDGFSGQLKTVSVTVSTALSVSQGHRVRVWFEKGLLELANSPSDDFHDGFKLTFHPAKHSDPALPEQVRQLAVCSQMAPFFPGRIRVTRRVVEQFALALAGQEHRAPTLADGLRVQSWIELARQSQR
jgi:predicted dehydrogenase